MQRDGTAGILAVGILAWLRGPLLGMSFPLPIRTVSPAGAYPMAWDWCVNGLGTVVAGPVSVVASVSLGFDSTVLLALALHAGEPVLSASTRERLRPFVPTSVRKARSLASGLQGRLKSEWPLLRFQWAPNRKASYALRRSLVKGMRLVHRSVRSAHTHGEMVTLYESALSIPRNVEGCIVEAGCFKGGSTAKLSLVARACGRQLVVLDSFAGIPENSEAHGTTVTGEKADFAKGLYCGELEEVRENVRRFGAIDVCEFVPGWFEETMPGLTEPVAMAFVDVDLASSTRTCLRYLYPLLVPGGTIFSHEGHLPLCIAAMSDDRFWSEVIGFRRPDMPDLGTRKLVRITKPLK